MHFLLVLDLSQRSWILLQYIRDILNSIINDRHMWHKIILLLVRESRGGTSILLLRNWKAKVEYIPGADPVILKRGAWF